MDIPDALARAKYISLETFRRNGVGVRTPVWFAETDGKLVLFTNPGSGKVRRMRNNPQVRVAPCTIRGRVTGPEFAAMARILSPEEWPRIRKLMERKYWLMRVPFLWSKDNIFMELELI
ncbi:MAG TPA: PPOX class F420-dependent oxidoreductase [Terriglobales bacterium]|nr:PPOX class F420-dependent oxidoreductase [Terriglobales bacterium]